MIDRQLHADEREIGLETAQVQRPLPFERVVDHLIGGRKPAAVNLGEPPQIFLGGRAFGRQIGVGQIIAELPGIAHVAPVERVQRIALQIGLIALRQKCAKLPGRAGGGCDRRCAVHSGRRSTSAVASVLPIDELASM